MVTLLTASLVHSQASGEEIEEPRRVAAGDLDGFYAAVGDHFGVPAAEVERLAAQGGLPPAQVLVVHFLARQSMRNPLDVLAEHRAGRGWREIAVASRLEPDLFYYPLPRRGRRPFTNVYALYEEQPRNRWSWETVPLGDGDIEELVGRRFVAELAGADAPRTLRALGESADLVSLQHLLLAGQRTATHRAAAADAVRS
jgi:hypothetical protein